MAEPPNNKRPHLMIVVGEPSGDALGAQLMKSLTSKTGGEIQISGVGGNGMAGEGLVSQFPLSDTAVMGLKEVGPKIPLILRRVREVADKAMQERPDAVVLIDAPDFTHRIARRLSKRAPDIKVIKYVAPQVWASRPGRAKSMSEISHHLLALLPFEVPFFEQHGLSTTFVGHPVVERRSMIHAQPDFRSARGIPPDAPILAVLPGSRSNEVRTLLPVFRETVARLKATTPNLVCVLPTVSHVKAKVEAEVEDWPTPIHLIEGEENKFAAFCEARAAVAASGTISTELALANVPMVIAYKVGWITAFWARRIITVDYFTLINLLVEREAIQELIQEDCTPDKLAPAVQAVLWDESARAGQRQAFSEALDKLGINGPKPSDRAADAILTIIQPKST